MTAAEFLRIAEPLFHVYAYEDLYVDYYADRAGYEEIFVRELIEPTTYTDEKGNRIASLGRATIGSQLRKRE
jgi:hypothetical protein